MTGIVGPSIPAKGSLITGRWVSSWVGPGGSPIEGERPHFSGWWLVTYWKLSRYYLTWHSSIFAVPCMLQVMIYSLACLMCITLVYLHNRAIARINDGINIGVTISWTLTSTSSQLTNIFQRVDTTIQTCIKTIDGARWCHKSLSVHGKMMLNIPYWTCSVSTWPCSISMTPWTMDSL